jgi:hypothetical protein
MKKTPTNATAVNIKINSNALFTFSISRPWIGSA